MKKTNPKLTLERITTVKRVWGTLRPNGRFFGLSKEEFAARVQPSLDARAELESIDEHRDATAVRRDASDVESMDLIQRIVNAIKADPNEGEDGEVYAALGYVRKAQRSQGRPRKIVTPDVKPNGPPNAAPEEGASTKDAA